MSTKYIIDVDEFHESEETARATIYQQLDTAELDGKNGSKQKGRPYAFWVSDKKIIEEWERYFEITNRKIGEAITTAINEYIKRNPITHEQKVAYNNKLMKMFEEI